MLGKQVTKLIIVCDDKTKNYANYLRQLISVNDDKDGEVVGIEDGTVDAAVWTEEEYGNNAPTISSNEHILFIGENKTSKSEIGSMSIRFKKYGMSYGWLGKRAMMTVDDTLLSPTEYKEFIDFCASYKQYFDRNAYEENTQKSVELEETASIEGECAGSETSSIGEASEKKKRPIVAINKAVEFLGEKVFKPVADVVEAGAVGAYENIKNLTMKKKINDQQYRALTVILYLDGLKEFLEG